MNCAVSVDRLVVRFREIEAGISFALERGAGKTTMLRVPMTLLRRREPAAARYVSPENSLNLFFGNRTPKSVAPTSVPRA